MKRILCVLFACVAMLVACADDDSDFAMQPKEDTSSSKIAKSSSSSSVKSSSSSTRKSSSSSKVSSSSSKTSSSSIVDPSTVVKGSMTDSRDGQTYKTVTIGSQTWMAENLNFVTEKSQCYGNEDSKCAEYGRCYTWYDAMRDCAKNDWDIECEPLVRGVCPEGWHLPSLKEWQILVNAVGGLYTAGGKLKSTSGWLNDGNGTDDYSFSVIAAWNSEDVRFHEGKEGGEVVYFWSSTTNQDLEGDYREYFAYTAYMDYQFDYLLLEPTDKRYYFPVRCLKD